VLKRNENCNASTTTVDQFGVDVNFNDPNYKIAINSRTDALSQRSTRVKASKLSRTRPNANFLMNEKSHMVRSANSGLVPRSRHPAGNLNSAIRRDTPLTFEIFEMMSGGPQVLA
jgi:hypothetical protein